jgi:arabinofuranan 3-O-arabinosyltransferase
MQDQGELDLADGRLRLLGSSRAALVVYVGCGLTVICTLLVLVVSAIVTSGDGPRAMSNDFRVFWAAGQMALDGDFLGVFDTDRLTAVHGVDPEYWMPWLYPPGFLFLIAPLGALGFTTGFAILSLLSVALMALAIRPFVAGSKVAWLAFSLAPAYLPILVQGQNGLLWLAGLVAALAALRTDRWVLAGVFIGLLTLKPQYGLLIPVALLAAGLWWTILSASVTALIVAAVPTIWTGLDYWPLFLRRMGEYSDYITATMPTLILAASPFAMFVRLGLDPEAAFIGQAVVTVAAAFCVFLIWRSRQLCFDTKAASLLIASFLAAPVTWYNEAAIMALVGLFLVRAGILGRTASQWLLLAVLWFGAGWQSMGIFLGLADKQFPWALVTTPVMLLCLALCLSRYLAVRRTPVWGA